MKAESPPSTRRPLGRHPWRLLRVLGAVTGLLGCAHRPEVCRPGQMPAPARLPRSAAAGYHLYTHAHNDYEHAHPLSDALGQRFYSVEADIWYDGGKLSVSHLGVFPKGTLKELYLDPLQQRVDANAGSVYGDGLPITLVLDLKENHPDLPRALHELLNRYPMLTVFTDSSVTPGAVTVVLTGDDAAKRRFVESLSPRRAIRDSNDYASDDPPADHRWGDYALSWGRYLGWNGAGQMPDEERKRLACIVENAHALGRKVRFWGGPDRAEAWGAQLDLGVDFINSDKLAELNAFLDAQR